MYVKITIFVRFFRVTPALKMVWVIWLFFTQLHQSLLNQCKQKTLVMYKNIR